jgi:hypothetical protein
MLIIFTNQLITTMRIIWFYHRSRSTAVNVQTPTHLCVPKDYAYEPKSINKLFKCVFAYARQLGV